MDTGMKEKHVTQICQSLSREWIATARPFLLSWFFIYLFIFKKYFRKNIELSYYGSFYDYFIFLERR